MESFKRMLSPFQTPRAKVYATSSTAMEPSTFPALLMKLQCAVPSAPGGAGSTLAVTASMAPVTVLARG